MDRWIFCICNHVFLGRNLVSHFDMERIAVGVVYPPARKHPHSAEGDLRPLAEHQGFETLATVANQDHRGRGDRRGADLAALRQTLEVSLVPLSTHVQSIGNREITSTRSIRLDACR